MDYNDVKIEEEHFHSKINIDAPKELLVIKLVQKYSRGYVTNSRQAIVVLIVVSVILILLSILISIRSFTINDINYTPKPHELRELQTL